MMLDTKNFIKNLKSHQIAQKLFDDSDIFITRAPGRLDVMGGIADYSGSLTLEMPIAEATFAALQKQNSRKIEIVSLNAEQNKRTNNFEMSLDDFFENGTLISYEKARLFFSSDAKQNWAAYIAGAFLVLMREKGNKFDQGAKILISSNVPEGKGVSSSAAIEVASLQAIATAFEIELELRELAILCQKVENLIVGAPCGVMDQMTSACGKSSELIALLCQPAELLGTRKIPDEIAVWGIDSGIRHSVGGGNYGSVRTGAFIGYRIIAEIAKLEVKPTKNKGVVLIEDKLWNGYLANISPTEFEKDFASKLPETISGNEFLERFSGITDTVTKVDPKKTYAVLKPTAHPVYENFRVHQFEKLLVEELTENSLEKLGLLMYQSHESYSACGLGTDGTDLIVELVKKSANLFGAKITGGGSGGAVAVLGRKDADFEIEKVAEEYERRTGHQPYIFKGSSIGAAEFGYIKLTKNDF